MRKILLTILYLSMVMPAWLQTPTHINTHSDKESESIWTNPYYIGALILGVILLFIIYRWGQKIIRTSQRMKKQEEEKNQ